MSSSSPSARSTATSSPLPSPNNTNTNTNNSNITSPASSPLSPTTNNSAASPSPTPPSSMPASSPAKEKEKDKKAKKPPKIKKSVLNEQLRLLELAKHAEEDETQKRRDKDEKDALELKQREAAAARLLAQEAARLEQQCEEEEPFRKSLIDREREHDAAAEEEEKWRRYCCCSALPDARDEAQLNTYLSIWRGSAQQEEQPPHTAYRNTVEQCGITEKVTELLEEERERARETFHLSKSHWVSSYSSLLHALISSRLDDLTGQFLSRVDEYETHDTKTFSVAHSTHTLAYGLWVHSSTKHGRVKRIELPSLNFHIELPVALQKSRTSIRVVRSLYDAVAEISYGAAAPAVPLAQQDAPEFPPPLPSPAQLEQEGRALYTQTLSANVPHFTSLGGVINIEQIALPPPPKKAKFWTMRDQVSNQLTYIPYPPTGDESSQAPLRVSFPLPSHLYLAGREPHFGWWDTKHGCWRQEGLILTQFETASPPLVHISMHVLKPIAIIQPRALDFPYRDWSMKAEQHDSLRPTFRVTVVGSRFPVVFTLGHSSVRLIEPKDNVLKEMNEEYWAPGTLLARMSRAGINVQPTVEDAAYCRKPWKNLVLLLALHEHIAEVLPLFQVEGCRGNSASGDNKVMFRIRLIRDSVILQQARAKHDAEAAALAEIERQNAPPVVEQVEEEDDRASLLPPSATPTLPLPVEPESQPELPSVDPEVLRAQRMLRGEQWVTVLVELQDEKERSQTIHEHEHIAGGGLLKFTVVLGFTKDVRDSTPVAGCTSHISLRRCLLAYFYHLTPHCLQRALDMRVKEPLLLPVDERAQVKEDEMVILESPTFLPGDAAHIESQQTIKKMLNLINPFTFH